MSEYISRDAAIETLIKEGRTVDSRYLESERIIHESDAVEAISMLPAVIVTNGVDCISRQDVLDMLKILRNHSVSVYEYDRWILGLPSVVPSILVQEEAVE